jgi:hypothetical protein
MEEFSHKAPFDGMTIGSQEKYRMHTPRQKYPMTIFLSERQMSEYRF